ncbi:MAG: hypothetical protein U9R60_10525, partial [Bacteroidota bacterium]|nr:hypothetical protein [Bacteroidota bacterium]
SSNRGSNGNQFNIIHKNLDFSYHVKDDVLDVHTGYSGLSVYEERLLTLIRTDNDELGPWTFWGPQEYSYFFYANNQDGDFDIKFVYNLKSDFGTYGGQEMLNGPVNFDPANSESDDLYPCITADQRQIFFCSNRDGMHFNIYSLPLPSEEELHDFFLSGEPGVISLESVLSSDQNDKCPFIQDDLLVFASDREGGYGGFDLYYSQLEDGAWSAPVNFGPAINSESDEYRPIAFSFDEIEHLMLFSSDRPGGAGGFDLYMVKLDNAL